MLCNNELCIQVRLCSISALCKMSKIITLHENQLDVIINLLKVNIYIVLHNIFSPFNTLKHPSTPMNTHEHPLTPTQTYTPHHIYPQYPSTLRSPSIQYSSYTFITHSYTQYLHTTPHHSLLHLTIPYYTTPLTTTPHHSLLHLTTPYHTTPLTPTLNHSLLHHTTHYRTTPFHPLPISTGFLV